MVYGNESKDLDGLEESVLEWLKAAAHREEQGHLVSCAEVTTRAEEMTQIKKWT